MKGRRLSLLTERGTGFSWCENGNVKMCEMEEKSLII